MTEQPLVRSLAHAIRKKTWTQTHDIRVAYLVYLPCVLVVVVLGLYPAVRVLQLSLFRADVFFTYQNYVGLDNIRSVLQSEEMLAAIENDLVFTGFSVSIQFIVGLLVALLLNQDFPGRNIARGVLLFSYVVPIVVVALVWKFMLNDLFGIINFIIWELHLPVKTTWFARPDTAMPTVIMITVWKYFPFFVIVFLAQLQSIPQELYEAAKIDGANQLQEFWHVTWPLLRPVAIIGLLLRTIWTFNNFSVISLLTEGGPLSSTMTPPVLIHNVVFGQYMLGRGAAMAIVLFVLLIIASVVYGRLYSRAQRQLDV
ncbi:MAG: sugar ABC transporter permease [Chloroflexi bacterium]|nr:sugar ABC transporter permease [Chloroflexota bacterium]